MSRIVENGIIISDDDITFYGDTEQERKLNQELYHCCLDISAKDDEIAELRLENKALRQLLEWAEECDFGLDQIVADDDFDFDKFYEETQDMNYIDSLIWYAKEYLKNKKNNINKGE